MKIRHIYLSASGKIKFFNYRNFARLEGDVIDVE